MTGLAIRSGCVYDAPPPPIGCRAWAESGRPLIHEMFPCMVTFQTEVRFSPLIGLPGGLFGTRVSGRELCARILMC